MSNLQKILHHVHFDEHDEPASSIKESLDGCEIVIAKAQAAIAELVEECLPVKFDSRPPNSLEYAAGYNQAVNKIRNNLIKKGIINA